MSADHVIAVPVATLWTGPDAPRAVDAPATADVPDLNGWLAGLDRLRDGRRGLHGRTVTQALLGEPVQVLGESGDWLEVALPWQPRGADLYPGWVRRAHVVPGTAPAGAEPAVLVTSPRVVVRTASGDVVLSFGTRLPTDGPRVRLPDGRTGTLPVQPPAPDPLTAGRAFLGLPYLWGGLSTWGLDCSGLVHLTQRAAGRLVPRDSSDQHAAAMPLDPAAVEPGDLYFFGRDQHVTHVGYATTRASSAASHRPRTMLHAPEETRLLEETALAPERTAVLVSVGRIAGT